MKQAGEASEKNCEGPAAAAAEAEEESKDEVVPNQEVSDDDDNEHAGDFAAFEKQIGAMIMGNWSKNGEQVGSKASPVMQMVG